MHQVADRMLPDMGALDELLATIRRLPLPDRLRVIEQATLEAAEDTPKPAAVSEPTRTLSVDEFLAARLTPPPGVRPVSLQDMDRTIAEGASVEAFDTNVVVRLLVGGRALAIDGNSSGSGTLLFRLSLILLLLLAGLPLLSNFFEFYKQALAR